MIIRTTLLSFAIGLAALATTQPAFAHGYGEDEEMPARPHQPAPMPCTDLATRTAQPGDADNAELKALKARCDVEKKAATKAKDAKAAQPAKK
jgi:hypothetical protein